MSGTERLAKPDPAIFELAVERFGLDPGRTVFVDDVARNAAGRGGLRLPCPRVHRRRVRCDATSDDLGLPVSAA